MDRITRPAPRRDDDAIDEFAQLEARSLGIAGRKRFRELLHRIEIDGDSSRMQRDDVLLGCPHETRFLAINLGLELRELGADHASRHLPLGNCIDQTGSLAARILQLALGRGAFARSLLREPRPLFGKAPAGGLNYGGVLEFLTQAPQHCLLDPVKPALAAIRAISRLDRARAPRHRPAALWASPDEA